jgi:N-acylneuraminate cytidylyltransferase
MHVLALIPARGGSKALPRKNIKLLDGKPLLAYSIMQAQREHRIGRIIVSTDDEEIVSIAKQYGADVPFLRPRELAEDLTPDWPVFQHALQWLKINDAYEPDFVVHLRPTSPLRRPTDISAALDLMIDSQPDSVISVSPVKEPPQKMWRIIEGKAVRLLPSELNIAGSSESPRQLLETIYRQNGIVDVVRPQIINERKTMLGDVIIPFLTDAKYAIDIDTQEDFYAVEKVFLERMRG